jgi:hypothetical protein
MLIAILCCGTTLNAAAEEHPRYDITIRIDPRAPLVEGRGTLDVPRRGAAVSVRPQNRRK